MSYIVGLLSLILLFILTIMHPGIVFITIWFIEGIPAALLSNYNDNN